MSVDNLLRETLHSYADQAPRNVGLLDAARDRAEARRRNQLLGAAGGAVLAAAAVLAGWALWPDTGSAPPAALSALEQPAYELPRFPFTPGLRPDNSGEPYAIFDDPVITLVHPHVDGGEAVLIVHVAPPGRDDVLATRFDLSTGIDIPGVATVRGNPVRLHGGGISWQEESGLNMVIRGDRRPNAYDWAEYGEALIEQPLPVQMPFTFELVPAGAEPVLVQRDQVILALGAGGAGGPAGGRLSVRLFDAADSAAMRRGAEARWQDQVEPVRVGDRPAELIDRGEGWILYLPVADDLVLHMTSSGQPELSRDDLLRLAAGVGLTPHAAPHGAQ